MTAESGPTQTPWIAVLHEGDAVPDVPLVDSRGRRFSLARTGGATTLLAFVYARCAEARMCSLVGAEFAQVQTAVRGLPVRLVTITIDPVHDTPEVLARYGALFGADPRVWTLASGDPATVNALVARFGIVVKRLRPGLFAHAEALVAIDRDGRVAGTIAGAEWAPEDAVALARATAALPEAPLRRIQMWLASRVSAVCGVAGGTERLTFGGGLIVLAVMLALVGAALHRAFWPGSPSVRAPKSPR